MKIIKLENMLKIQTKIYDGKGRITKQNDPIVDSYFINCKIMDFDLKKLTFVY